MRSRPMERILFFAAFAVAALAVVTGGGSVTMPGSATGSPCADRPLAKAADGTPLPCDDARQEPPGTETGPVTEPPPTTTTTPETTTTEPATTEPATTTPATPPPAPPPSAKRSSTPSRREDRSTAKTARVPAAPLAAIPNNGTPTLSGGPYVFPVIGDASFGPSFGAPRADVAWHHGVDIFAPLGSPIVAVADGTLFSVGWNTIGGRRLWLRDRQGNYFYYAHLSAFAPVAVEGARVAAGTIVGYVGHSGDAMGTPDHLHFEIHPVSLLSVGYDGAVDPFTYVSSWLRLDRGFDVHLLAHGGSGLVPGAVLLGSWDISRASGAAGASLARAMDGAPLMATTAGARKELSALTSGRRTIPATRSGDAALARSLDAGAVDGEWSVWDLLAGCESGGRWNANTGNGFVGGLQFLPSTWASHGGTAFAPSPDLATRQEQIAIARRVLESQGWHAWPACSTTLGLRAAPDR